VLSNAGQNKRKPSLRIYIIHLGADDQAAEAGQQPMFDQGHLAPHGSELGGRGSLLALEVGLGGSFQALEVGHCRGLEVLDCSFHALEIRARRAFEALQIGFARNAVMDRLEDLGGDAFGRRSIDLLSTRTAGKPSPRLTTSK